MPRRQTQRRVDEDRVEPPSAAERAAPPPVAAATDPGGILFLQRTSGNRAVSALMRQPAGAGTAPAPALPKEVAAAVAAPLEAAPANVATDDPVAAGQLLPGLEAAVGQLHGAAGPAAGASPLARAIARSVLARQETATAEPAQSGTANGVPGSVPEVRKVMVQFTDYIKDFGGQPYTGPRGGDRDPVRACALWCDWLHRLCTPVLSQKIAGADAKLEADLKEEFALFLRRLALMRGFYNSLLPQPVFAGQAPAKPEDAEGAMPAQNRPDDPRRIQVVAGALADVGKVKAKEKDSEGRRIGHEHLKQIFKLAWPDFGDEAHKDRGVLTRPVAGKKAKAVKNEQTGKDEVVQVHASDVLVSWCGVGATYWYKRADPSFPDWVMEKGITPFLRKRGDTEMPMVGDLAVGPGPLWHHAILTWVDPGATAPKNKAERNAIRIKTVESNMNGGQIVETPSGHDKLDWSIGVYDPFDRDEAKIEEVRKKKAQKKG